MTDPSMIRLIIHQRSPRMRINWNAELYRAPWDQIARAGVKYQRSSVALTTDDNLLTVAMINAWEAAGRNAQCVGDCADLRRYLRVRKKVGLLDFSRARLLGFRRVWRTLHCAMCTLRDK